MSDYTLMQINSNECIGNSLSTINTNFNDLTNALDQINQKINAVSASDLNKIANLIPDESIAIEKVEALPGTYTISAKLTGIANFNRYPVVSAVNVGTQGINLLKGVASYDNKKTLEFRKLMAGPGVSLGYGLSGSLQDTVVISFNTNAARGEINTAINKGNGIPLAITQNEGVRIPIKTLKAGSGISLLSAAETVTIANTRTYTGQNIGTGAKVFASLSPTGIFNFKTISSNSNDLVITENENNLALQINDTLSAANIQSGAGLFKEKNITTNTLLFKSLTGSPAPTAVNLSPSNVIFTELANSVNLTVYDKVTGTNAFPGTYIPPGRGQAGRIFKDKKGNNLNFKTLIPGNNIHITNSLNEDEIVISAAIEGLSGGAVNYATNVGGEKEIFKERNGVELVFRTLSAGAGIDLSQQADTLTISAAGFPPLTNYVLISALTGTNLGSGIGLFDSKSGSSLRFKTLSATSPFIRLIDTSSTKTVTISVGNVVSSAQNLESLVDIERVGKIYKDQQITSTGNILQFRPIIAGQGITIEQQTDQILISNEYADPAPLNNLLGFKNKLINGNFDIWQWQKRATTASNTISTFNVQSVTLTASGFTFGYLADRIGFTSGNKLDVVGSIVDPIATFSKVSLDFNDTSAAGVLSSCNSSYAGRFTLNTAALTAYIQPTVGQRIENVRALAGKTVTFSFWARSNNVGSNRVNVGYTQCYKATSIPLSQACRQFPSFVADSFEITSTWQRYASTFTLPEISQTFWSSIWGSNDQDALWDSFTQIGIEVLGDAGRYIDMVGLQLEENFKETTFEKRPIGIELELCQRYYETGNRFQTQFATNSANLTYTPFKTTKRRVPTMQNYGVLLKNLITSSTDVYITDHVYSTVTLDSFSTSFSGDNNIVNAKPYIYNWAASAEF